MFNPMPVWLKQNLSRQITCYMGLVVSISGLLLTGLGILNYIFLSEHHLSQSKFPIDYSPMWFLSIYIFISISLIILSLLVVYGLAKKISFPIQLLNHLAKSSSLHNDLRLEELSGHDEVAKLARSFSEVVNSLKMINSQLESEVQARTYELKEALLRAQENQERYHALFYNLKLAMILIDPKTQTIVEANNAACQYYGYSYEAMQNMPICAINIAPQYELSTKLKAVCDEESSHFLFQHRLSNGDLRNVEIHAGPLHLQGRTLVYSIIHDITEQQYLENQRYELQQRLEKLVAQAPGFLYQYILRPDGSSCFPYASPRINEIYRLTPEQVREDASAVFNLLHPKDLEAVRCSILNSAQSLTPWIQEYRVCFTDGSEHWLLGQANPEPLADGSVLWHGYIADITQRIEQQQFNKALLDNNAAAIMLISPERNIYLINKTAETILGYSLSDIQGLSTEQLHINAENYKDFFKFYQPLRQNNHIRVEYPLQHKDGHTIWCLMHGTLLDSEKPDGLTIWSFFDVSERHQVQQQLQAQQNRLRVLLNRFHEGILVEDETGNIVLINQAIINIFHLRETTDFYIGKPRPAVFQKLAKLSHNPSKFLDDAQQLVNLQNPQEKQELEIKHNRYLERDFIPIIDNNLSLGNLWVFRDISRRKAHESYLQRLATTDSLTNLANRRSFYEQLAKLFDFFHSQNGFYCALIMLDLDYFKKINDEHGHPAGDVLLQHISTLMRNSLRHTDVAGRLGGEEFAILLPMTTLRGAIQFAERLRHTIEISPLLTQEQPALSITASFGVTEFISIDYCYESILQRADEALYRAKRNGRNRVEAYT